MPRNQEQGHGGQGQSGPGRGKQSQGGERSGRSKASPAEVEKSLKGMDYPADKDELIQHARSHNAPSDVIQCLEQMPDREYGSPTDVAQGLKNIL